MWRWFKRRRAIKEAQKRYMVLGFLWGTTGRTAKEICDATHIGSGSIYSVLDELEYRSHIESWWDRTDDTSVPRRRLYKLCGW